MSTAAIDSLPSTSSKDMDTDVTASYSVGTSSQLRRRYRRPISKSVTAISNRSKMVKASRSWRERKQTVETIGQLKQLVPTVPKDEQVSRFELLQHVIDYIVELQRQLSDPLTVAEDREP